MTVRELIIEVQLQVQRKNSFKRDSASEQQIVWRLNSAQNRLIKSWIKPDPNNPNKFLVDQKANTDIQRLITPNVVLPTIIDSSNRVYAYLPNDFRYLVNDRSRVLENCKDAFEDAEDATDYTRTVTALKFADSAKASANYYESIVISVTKDGVTSTSTLTTDGTPTVKEKYELIEYIIKETKRLGYNLYWEKFDTCYKPDSFILVPDVGTSLTISITVDGTALIQTPVSLSTVNIYNTIDPVDTTTPVNRGYKADFLYDAVQHNYYDQPQPDSPVSQLADGKIYVHTSERFIVSEIILDYIRMPRRISLYLNHSCELDESVHEEVCSIAAEMILGNIEASNYSLKVQENINRLEKT